MSYRMYCNVQYGLGAHGALRPLFPGSLTRNVYRKKIPEMTFNVPHVPPIIRVLLLVLLRKQMRDLIQVCARSMMVEDTRSV